MRLFLEAGLGEQAISRLSELLIDRTYRSGETIVSANAYADSLILIVEGSVDAFNVDGDQVASLTAGDTYGEKQLLEPGLAPTSLRATTEAHIRELDGAAYDQFAREFPESAFALQAHLARRVLRELKKAQENLRLLFETFKAS